METQPIGTFKFALISVLVGAVSGLGAVVFRGMISLFHNAFFLGRLSAVYDANVHTPPSPWGALVILVPVLGAMGVVFLVKNFAPEAKGQGVAEVMDAIYYKKGIIRPVVAVIKALASALSIGTGGSSGREGPIIQIGASFGSTVGQRIPMPAWQRIALIAGGAGAGVAATFNTPVGGLIFAVEIMVLEVNATVLVPVAIATATGTYVGQLFFGTHPSFAIPALETPYFRVPDPFVLLSYVGLGGLIGVVSALFIRCRYAFEDFFDTRIGGSYYRRHLLGMLLVGALMFALMRALGHYYVDGLGYATVQDVLRSQVSSLPLLLGLFALKLLATSLTLGSGASGGIFSPALFMGATLGASYGVFLGSLFPGLGVGSVPFAVAGMAGLVGGATGAAIAAIVMVFEMTLDYSVVLPIAITVMTAYGVRKLLCSDSIYTLGLTRRGHLVPDTMRADFLRLRPAKEVMDTHFGLLPAATTVGECTATLDQEGAAPLYLLQESGRVVAVVTRGDLARACRMPDSSRVLEVAQKEFLTVGPDTSVMDVISKMRSQRLPTALVVDPEAGLSATAVRGVITNQEIAGTLVAPLDISSGR